MGSKNSPTLCNKWIFGHETHRSLNPDVKRLPLSELPFPVLCVPEAGSVPTWEPMTSVDSMTSPVTIGRHDRPSDNLAQQMERARPVPRNGQLNSSHNWRISCPSTARPVANMDGETVECSVTETIDTLTPGAGEIDSGGIQTVKVRTERYGGGDFSKPCRMTFQGSQGPQAFPGSIRSD